MWKIGSSALLLLLIFSSQKLSGFLGWRASLSAPFQLAIWYGRVLLALLGFIAAFAPETKKSPRTNTIPLNVLYRAFFILLLPRQLLQIYRGAVETWVLYETMMSFLLWNELLFLCLSSPLKRGFISPDFDYVFKVKIKNFLNQYITFKVWMKFSSRVESS